SPSYLFTLSNEIAAAYMDEEGRQRLDWSVDKVNEVIERLQKIDRVFVFTGDDFDSTIKAKDNTKILFKIDGIKGSKVKKILRTDHNIRLEMSDYYYGLILTSLMNDEEDYEKLIKAIEEIAATAPYEEINSVSIEMPTPQVVMNLAAAYYGKKELVDLESAIGRVSAASIIPYPPGIPLIVPGEMITRELYDHIIMTMENGLEIVGLMGYNKDKIVVVE
ncbi:MAG: arginine / lysine / ornithine decarboxylase, partial [Tissierellia bacterium]|nr:arginine / lysine / ornithine decarboxylase [Tissierellia bacterium]